MTFEQIFAGWFLGILKGMVPAECKFFVKMCNTCIKKSDRVYTNFCGLKVSKYSVKCRMLIFYNHFYWFFTWLWKHILSASLFRQLCL